MYRQIDVPSRRAVATTVTDRPIRRAARVMVAGPLPDPRTTVPTPAPTRPLEHERLDEATMLARSEAFLDTVRRRRTVRDFAPDPVPRRVVENAIAAAASAPSGANGQPWHFVLVGDPGVKRRIREAAEAEERAFYAGRAGEAWLDALAPLGTDADKPFLEVAPWLIAVFMERWARGPDGTRAKHYYMPESVGISCGLLLTALHASGLATLTHTPAPMGFLKETLGRPENERPYLLVVTGLPAKGARVPAIERKPLDAVMTVL